MKYWNTDEGKQYEESNGDEEEHRHELNLKLDSDSESDSDIECAKFFFFKKTGYFIS